MTDTEIIERFFKARGWEYLPEETADHHDGYVGWVNPDGEEMRLPKILTDFPAFKEHVLEVMGDEGYGLLVDFVSIDWVFTEYTDRKIFTQQMKDNNILHAAVQSATRYFEGKK